MLVYNDLYELLRKEKYSETLQGLHKNFVRDFCEYLKTLKNNSSEKDDLFENSGMESKKQLENAISLFKSLVLRRKKKILNLVFIAAETGIMKRDYENMLDFEKKVYDKLVKAFEEGDKELSKMMNGKKGAEEERSKMVIFSEDVKEFVDMNGNVIGPFGKGELANLDSEVGKILVSGGKADFVDEG